MKADYKEGEHKSKRPKCVHLFIFALRSDTSLRPLRLCGRTWLFDTEASMRNAPTLCLVAGRILNYWEPSSPSFPSKAISSLLSPPELSTGNIYRCPVCANHFPLTIAAAPSTLSKPSKTCPLIPGFASRPYLRSLNPPTVFFISFNSPSVSASSRAISSSRSSIAASRGGRMEWSE